MTASALVKGRISSFLLSCRYRLSISAIRVSAFLPFEVEETHSAPYYRPDPKHVRMAGNSMSLVKSDDQTAITTITHLSYFC